MYVQMFYVGIHVYIIYMYTYIEHMYIHLNIPVLSELFWDGPVFVMISEIKHSWDEKYLP